jgi:hypothetical protein
VGGPAHAREMVETGAGLVCASRAESLAHRVADCFQRGGVVCEVSDDRVGVELAGVAENAAAVAVGATQAQGLNAAGETVRLLSHAVEREALEAPVVRPLAHLIEGTLPLDDWIAMVRAKQPPPARFGRRPKWWSRMRDRLSGRPLESEGR